MMAHLLRSEYMAFAAASETVDADAARSAAGIGAIFSAAVAWALSAGIPRAAGIPPAGLPAAVDELTERVRAALGPEAADIDPNLTAALIARALDPTAPAQVTADGATVMRAKVLLTYGIVKHLGLRGDDVDTLLRARPSGA